MTDDEIIAFALYMRQRLDSEPNKYGQEPVKRQFDNWKLCRWPSQ
jgi:hypothetical protein